MDADDDLLGPAPKKRPGPAVGFKQHEKPIGPLNPRTVVNSQLRESAARKLDYRLAQHRQQRATQHLDGELSTNLQDVHAGVTVAWLSQVFGMDPTTVKKRLADCPPLHRRKAGYIYDLKVAAQYLVKPVFDVKKYLKDMKPSELPSQLQKEYWDAALKRQKWEENAGMLWRTEKVLAVLSETFLLIKSTMQLWTEDLERTTGLDAAQRAELVRMVDGLQNDIHEGLVKMQSRQETTNMQAEIEIDDPLRDEPDAEEDLIG